MKLHEKLDVPLPSVHEAMEDVILTDRNLPDSSIIRDSTLRLIRSGGKRLRPMLVMLGGRFGPLQDESKLVRTAVLLEYFHMASLVHDDIIDEAASRRGDISLHCRTNAYTATLTANYMITRSLEWYLDLAGNADTEQDTRVSANVAALASQLCLGEYNQVRWAYQYDITLRQYLRKTRQKTALLMASCLKAGAEVTAADPGTVRLLYMFGDAVGMAFQIQDDILDFVQSDRSLGKPAGADLRNGNITLPVIYALMLPELGASIRKLRPDSPAEAYREVVDAVACSPAILRAAKLRDRYAERAERYIGLLRSHSAHQDLVVLLREMLKLDLAGCS